MIRKLIFIMLTMGLSLSLQPVYAADTPTAPAARNLPMSTVLQNLKMNGYEIISKIELDKEVYNIEALSPQGKELSITMNAQSGEITSPKTNPLPRVSLLDAVKRVEGSGYHDLYKVEYSGGKYIVRALDQKDKKVKLKVNGDTGEIAKAWF